jgi:hypothetical protein
VCRCNVWVFSGLFSFIFGKCGDQLARRARRAGGLALVERFFVKRSCGLRLGREAYVGGLQLRYSDAPIALEPNGGGNTHDVDPMVSWRKTLGVTVELGLVVN